MKRCAAAFLVCGTLFIISVSVSFVVTALFYLPVIASDLDKHNTKMTALEDLERRELDLKKQLEIADSLEERKHLRVELREVRKQIYEGPKTVASKNEINSSKKLENEKKESIKEEANKKIVDDKIDINNNNVSEAVTDNKRKPTRLNSKEEEMPSITVQSRSFKLNNDSNNNSVKTATTIVDDSNADASSDSFKSRTAADRAARRTRRAAHMKSLGTTENGDTGLVENKEETKTVNGKNEDIAPKQELKSSFSSARVSVRTSTNTSVSEKPAATEEKVIEKKTDFADTNKPKVTSTSSSSALNDNKSASSSGLRRTATWAPRDRMNASRNIGSALNKFGAQAGPSPFTFGTSYLKKKDGSPNKEQPEKRLSTNKYTPTINPPASKSYGSTETKTPDTNQRRVSASEELLSVLQNKEASVNKFNANFYKKDTETINEPSPTTKEFGTNYIHKKFSPPTPNSTSDFSVRQQPSSYNKYNQSPLQERSQGNTSTGLRRAVSMKVTPTFQRATLGNVQSNNHNAPSSPADTVNTQLQSLTETNETIETNAMNVSSGTSETNTQNATLHQGQGSSTNDRPKSTYNSNLVSSGLRNGSSAQPQGRTNPSSSAQPQGRTNPSGTQDQNKRQSVADRMAFFRQAQEQEKKDMEKKKQQKEQRKRMSSVPAAPVVEKKEEEKKEEEKKEVSPSKTTEPEKTRNAPCLKKREKKKVVRRTMSIGSIVLDWVQEMIRDYPVEVKNFSGSWNNGMAFCALIHRFNPDEFDFSALNPENKRENFDTAFNTGLKAKNIPILLDTEDMVKMARPEPRSVQTYIQWIWSVYGPTSGYGPTPKEVQSGGS